MDLRLQRKVNRIRRNHAIEHATIRILAGRYPDKSLAGQAGCRGFVVYGDVDSEAVAWAVGQALQALRDDPALAVHPRCGTNLVVTAILSAAASLLAIGSLGRRRRDHGRLVDTLPRILVATTAAAVLAEPLGPRVQQALTTSADVEGVRVAQVRRARFGRTVKHTVLLQHDAGDGL
jgi:hypothetical protein